MSSSTYTDEPDLRMYGGWRKARAMGLFGLGPIGTIIVLATIFTGIIFVNVSMQLFFVYLPCAAAVVAATATRWNGETLWDRVQRGVRWRWGVMRGYTSLRAGQVYEHTGVWELPGLLAPTRVLTVEDGAGGHFGVVHDQRTGLLTATLLVDARSTWLVEGSQADGWVGNFHSWLADLGVVPMVAWVAVVVETAPEPGTTLLERVRDRVDPNAPADCIAMLDELVARSPSAAADVDTRVSITFDPARSTARLRDLGEQTSEVSRLLFGLESSLSQCGVGVLGRASAAELAGIVRTAYDPASRGECNRLLGGPPGQAAELLTWGEAGPIGAEEQWDEYWHDSGCSVTYQWQEAPRQQVVSSVLCPLLAPSSWPCRVTLLYRPFSAVSAARELENEVNASTVRTMMRHKQGRDETARDAADHQRARQATREEAEGAGVVRMTMYVTVTVEDRDELPTACAEVEGRGKQSKILLRRAYGAQAAAFAVGLPAGIHPAHAGRRGRK